MPLQLAPLLNRHSEARRVENTAIVQGGQRNVEAGRPQHSRRKFGTALSLSSLNVKASAERTR